MTTRRTVYRSCHLCEAMCGLAIEVEDERIARVTGHDDDVFSRGFICPKGAAIGAVHHDPDRLRTPVRRTPDGTFVPIAWDEAMDLVGTRLGTVRDAYGADAIATYMGNPIVHNHGALLVRSGFLKSIGTRNSYSASSQDTAPRFATSYWLYGSSLVIPVPDIDRTQYFLCIGANPYVSNGSFMTAPDVKSRLRAIRTRGGKVVVVDPRRTETAREADEWVPIRPGTDAAFLLGLAQVLVSEGRTDGRRIAALANGFDDILPLLAPFTPERVAAWTGVRADVLRRLAHELADAPSSVAYTRIGVCNTKHGTLATWANDILNLVAGRMGEVGGWMFPSPAIDISSLTPMLGDGWGRWRSRVRNLPETFGDLPSATLADEIETPGPGQVRAFICFAGNPVLSIPNGRRLARALGKLDFMVAIDLYVNETTRHADVILPPSWALAEEHVDLLFPNHAVRNTIRSSPAVVSHGPGERADWQILLDIAERLGGGPFGQVPLDAAARFAKRFGVRWNPTGIADLLLRLGRHGDRFLPWSKGWSLARLAQHPNGIDLGPLEPGISHRVLHRDRRMHLAPPPVLEALRDFAEALDRPTADLVLIGRRELRTCNSWMHNVPSLVAGRERCVLHVHPADAERAGITTEGEVLLESRVHSGPVRVQVTDDVAPGVVSLPHGWGHAEVAPWQKVAGAHPGVSANDWTDDADVEGLVGQSVMNGVPVRLRPIEAQVRAAHPQSFAASRPSSAGSGQET